MDNAKQARSRIQNVLALLGLNKASSQPKQTKALLATDYLCLILVCLGAGYLATLQGFDSLPLNADALAPFEEAKSLISNPNTHLFNIHVSRIASIFPDLTINTLLQLIMPKAGFLEIFSLYAWCTSSLFVLLATLLTNEIKQGKQLLTADSIKISLITITLLNISHPFNIAYSHFITPVHHGGNVLNTLLILTLAIRSIKASSKTGSYILLSSLIVLATLSNKMALFTAVAPSVLIFFAYLKGQQRKIHIAVTLLASLAGVAIGSLFNEQCAEPEFNLLGTLSAIQQYFQISWITPASALLATLSILYVIKTTTSDSRLPQHTAAGLVAISISSLSYFIYLPMLTSSGEAPLRYICVAYALITVFFVFYINAIGKDKRTIALILIIVATLISFQHPDRPEINIDKHQSLKQELFDRSERIEPFKNDAADFIDKMGYNSYLGLGDYWMSGATLASNSKIHVIPIHNTGLPDFWGATPQDIRRQIKPLNKNKTYLLTEDDAFKAKFEVRYGAPTQTWNYNLEDRTFTTEPVQTNLRLQIYDNPKIYNKVRKHSKKFKRQCNPELPKYRVR
jgi:hypothetical protein